VSGSLVNGILQAALATRNSALDRNALAEVAKAMPIPVAKPKSEQALALAARDSARRDSLLAPPPPKAEPAPAAARVVVALPFAAPQTVVRDERDGRDVRPVPSVFGLDVRQAVRTLNVAGFQVSLVRGTDVRTRPVAGSLRRMGSTVQLEMPAMVSAK
jgi:cell division protein FtsI (penicillin-binding protein 3)